MKYYVLHLLGPFVVCIATLGFTRAGSTTGSLSLDFMTFDKILAKHSRLLVKFDESFAWGEKQDVFEELCNRSANIPDLLIGEIQTSDYGSMKNKDMEQRFGIAKSDRPAYRLFLDHSDKPIKYDGRITLAGLSNFLFENIGIRLPLAHALPSFDALAFRFMKETREDARREILEEARSAKKAVKSEKKRGSADIYIKLMDKILEKGEEFVSMETARVENLLTTSKGLKDGKKASFTARLNILAAFKTFPAKDEL